MKVDSPGNIFKSPNDRQQENQMEELQKTILQMSKSNQEQNELFRTNLSSLTQRYDNLLSLMTSGKNTKLSPAAVEIVKQYASI